MIKGFNSLSYWKAHIVLYVPFLCIGKGPHINIIFLNSFDIFYEIFIYIFKYYYSSFEVSVGDIFGVYFRQLDLLWTTDRNNWALITFAASVSVKMLPHWDRGLRSLLGFDMKSRYSSLSLIYLLLVIILQYKKAEDAALQRSAWLLTKKHFFSEVVICSCYFLS